MQFATVFLALALAASQSAPALKVVVIEGEGAVNIIQQKTAVRPLVEIRDKNNVPVAGATVTFTIGGGGSSAAFAGGAQTLTVTTNAAGRAAASALNALSSGSFQIQVQAAYQGEIATAAISQTNFATAAAAAQAGASTGGGASSAAGGAAGGGGGISGTTIGIVGAAVAGGAVAATQVVGKSDSESGSGGSGENFDGYDGTLSGQVTATSHFVPSIGPATDCTFTRAISGTMRIEMFTGNASGRATIAMTQTPQSFTGNCIAEGQPITFTLLRENAPVSGGPSSLSFGATVPVGVEVYALNFKGTLSGRTINGTLTMDITSPSGTNPNHGGSTQLSITLSR